MELFRISIFLFFSDPKATIPAILTSLTFMKELGWRAAADFDWIPLAWSLHMIILGSETVPKCLLFFSRTSMVSQWIYTSCINGVNPTKSQNLAVPKPAISLLIAFSPLISRWYRPDIIASRSFKIHSEFKCSKAFTATTSMLKQDSCEESPPSLLACIDVRILSVTGEEWQAFEELHTGHPC